MASALASADGIDVVVNNAGASAVGPLEAFSIDQMAALLSLNVLGPMRVNNAVLPTMRARQSGLIIWITSTLGRVLPGRGGLYPATKWAAEGFAESLHYQVAPFGIDVAILEPGSFPTPATFKSMEAANQEIAAAYASPPPANAPARQPAPAGHQSPDPQEVADAVKRLIELRPASGRCGPWSARSSPRASPSTTRPTSRCARGWRNRCGVPTRRSPGHAQEPHQAAEPSASFCRAFAGELNPDAATSRAGSAVDRVRLQQLDVQVHAQARPL